MIITIIMPIITNGYNVYTTYNCNCNDAISNLIHVMFNSTSIERWSGVPIAIVGEWAHVLQ